MSITFLKAPSTPTEVEPDLVIDLPRWRVQLDGNEVELTRTEFRLLVKLAGEPGRVFTRRELLRDVWGYPENMRSRTVDSHASRLRSKLGDVFVHNVWGVGYSLVRT